MHIIIKTSSILDNLSKLCQVWGIICGCDRKVKCPAIIAKHVLFIIKKITKVHKIVNQSNKYKNRRIYIAK